MALFVWKDEYRVGVPQIDAQHKRLFEMAESLHQSMAAGMGGPVLASILDGLITYTGTHFTSEEAFMRSVRFPGLEAQKAAHGELTRQVLEFQRAHQQGRIALDVKMLHFLKNWLVEHIGGSDRQIGEWLRKTAT